MDRRQGALLCLLVSMVVVGCEQGSAGTASLEYSTEHVRFRDVVPRDGTLTADLVVVNVGDGPVTPYDVRVEGQVGDCGRLSTDAHAPFPTLEPGDRWTVRVTFEPAEGAEGGCGCFTTARLSFEYDVGSLSRRVPVSARGTCDAVFGCTPANVAVSDAVIEASYETEVRCVNVTLEDVEVLGVVVSGGDESAFSVVEPHPAFPAVVRPGGAVDFTVYYEPVEEGIDEDEALVVGREGSLFSIPLSGAARRARPLCTADAPRDPEPILEGPGYAVTLEAEEAHEYTGAVRAFWYYDDQPPLIADYLVTSGSYADLACEVGQSGHSAYWRGNACQADGGQGLFANIHALPYSGLVEEWLRTIAEWDEVTIRGYEVDQIQYDDGSWWQDAGCNTLIITWVCDQS